MIYICTTVNQYRHKEVKQEKQRGSREETTTEKTAINRGTENPQTSRERNSADRRVINNQPLVQLLQLREELLTQMICCHR